jgi:ribonuclease HI
VEYEALLHGLRIAKEIGVQHIMCCGDSDLVAQQVAGTYKARNKVMAAYRDEVDEMAKSFLGYDIKHVRREDNMAVDTLSKLGSSRRQFRQAYSLSICTYHQLRWWIQKIRN